MSGRLTPKEMRKFEFVFLTKELCQIIFFKDFSGSSFCCTQNQTVFCLFPSEAQKKYFEIIFPEIQVLQPFKFQRRLAERKRKTMILST
jgi:hypothetical protein